AFSAANFASSENIGTSNAIVLNRTGDTSGTSSVQISITGGTAGGSGIDYTSSSFPLMVNFAPGEVNKTAAIPINDDSLNEVSETITLGLGSPNNATIGTQSTTVLTITDNDPQPAISVNDVSIAEGDTGTTNATFTISLSAASGKSISVNYATANNSATLANSDYNASSGSLIFNPGETIKMVNVAVIGDGSEESNETFFLNLNTPANATIADAQGIGTIQDDDVPTPITGGNGNDTLVGTPGKDNLVGNAGPDILTGGAGDDQFVMNNYNDRQDTITDFTSGDDVINLVSLFDQYGITAATYTDAATQGYLSIITNGAGGSIVRFDSNGNGGFFDFTPPVNFVVVQGVVPTTLANDANFILQ
ncbi:MAG: type I secretion C-terminal target domain-containing protein, partial [Leptolyngbya sp. SIO3F4]|nr:type I secretion C-terminal target domain-containing protein [Leptolyngbya sp. SIO3F4]